MAINLFATLTLSALGKIFSRQHFEIISCFFQKGGFDISCKLSPLETICIKFLILFSGKNQKKIFQSVCRLRTVLSRVVSIKG